jgi:hypothetical protein
MEAQQEPIRGAAGPRVLVVEDDPDVALLLTHNPKARGYVGRLHLYMQRRMTFHEIAGFRLG